MKKFTFKLEALLKIRKRNEEQAQTKLTQERSKLKDLQMELFDLENFKADAEEEFERKRQSGRVFIDDFLLYNDYLNEMQKRIEVQIQKIINQENAVKLALKELEEAMKKRKAVEKLKEKRLEQYHIEMIAQEQIFLDEISLSIHTRK